MEGTRFGRIAILMRRNDLRFERRIAAVAERNESLQVAATILAGESAICKQTTGAGIRSRPPPLSSPDLLLTSCDQPPLTRMIPRRDAFAMVSSARGS